MDLLNVYLRKEKTTDELCVQRGGYVGTKFDTVVYKDETCTEVFCRIPWYYTQPRINQKTIVLNCFKWKVNWVLNHDGG